MSSLIPSNRPRSPDPLVDAALAGSLAAVAALLVRGADPSRKDDHGRSPLAAAIRGGHHDMMRSLLAAGADAREILDRDESLLEMAACNGDVEGVRLLLEAGADPNHRESDRITILMRATLWARRRWGDDFERRVAVLRLLIEAGADVNAVMPDGNTPLSSTEGEDEVVRLLLAAGARIDPHRDGQKPLLVEVMWCGPLLPSQEAGICRLIAAGAPVNVVDRDGISPLKRACDCGSRRVVAALLESGARRVGATTSPDQRFHHDTDSLPELHLAARAGDPHVVEMLLHDGAAIEEADRIGRTPLHWAAHFGRNGVVEVLLKAGADPNAGRDRGISPLRVAATDGHAGCVARLLAAGAEVDAANPGGVTALHLASFWQRRWIVPLLLRAGADPNRGDAAGRPPLVWALQECRSRTGRGRSRTAAVVERLFAAGADPSMRDRRGETALFAAVRSDQPDAVLRLLAQGADPNVVSLAGLTPLLAATLHAAVIEALLAGGADVNAVDPDGATPLHRMLRACRSTATLRYRTPYHRWDRRPLLDRLLAAGADVNHADGAGVTPLMLASQIVNIDVISPLLDCGADPARRDRAGKMAQDHAAAAGELPPDAPEPGYFHAVLRRFREYLDMEDGPRKPADFLAYLESKDKPPARSD